MTTTIPQIRALIHARDESIILTLWLDGILPARLYALTYEAE